MKSVLHVCCQDAEHCNSRSCRAEGAHDAWQLTLTLRTAALDPAFLRDCFKAADHPNVVKLCFAQNFSPFQSRFNASFAALRLDVACSPGRLHLVFEFVDANLKQSASHSQMSNTHFRYIHSSAWAIMGMQIGNQVHEEIWTATRTGYCAWGARCCVNDSQYSHRTLRQA